MTLTTIPLNADAALAARLVDELSDDPEALIRGTGLRINRLNDSTILNIKQYFQNFTDISESVETAAVAELGRLLNSPEVRRNIMEFAKYKRFPWEVAR